MRNILIVIVATMCLGSGLATVLRAQNTDWHLQQHQLKSQQKLERNALKIRQRNIKHSWRNSRVSSATRIQAKHQMQRERRDLGQRQRDARQDLRDRQRALRENQRMNHL